VKALACQYAILRFMPYPETGEFANIGVVLACPDAGYIDAKLMPRGRTRRVTAFFDQIKSNVIRAVVADLAREIERVKAWVAERPYPNNAVMVRQVFDNLTRPRETLLRSSEVRVVLAADPTVTLAELYTRLVEREIDVDAHHDRDVERAVRAILRRANLRGRFVPGSIGDDELHAPLPFVRMQGQTPVAAIKPLDLAKDEPNKVFDAGGLWVDRVRRMGRRHLLPAHMLFAVRAPDAQAGTAIARAAAEIMADLRDAHTEVTTTDDVEGITRFVEEAGVA
jgi:hypothetical protein